MASIVLNQGTFPVRRGEQLGRMGLSSNSPWGVLHMPGFHFYRIKTPLAQEDNRARSWLLQAQPEHIKAGALQSKAPLMAQPPAGSRKHWGGIVQVTLAELRNDSSFSFSESEPRHPFLCSRGPCQMLISNMTFTPHLQGDLYLQCNQGKASMHQTAFLLINPRMYLIWGTDVMKLSGVSSVSNLAKLNSSWLVEKLFQEMYGLQKEIFGVLRWKQHTCHHLFTRKLSRS